MPPRERSFAMTPAGLGPRLFMAVTGLVPLVVLAVLAVSAQAPYSASLEVEPERVRVRAALYGRAWARAPVDSASVRVADWTREPALAPTSRTNGIALPGYAEGWFRLRDGGPALVFATRSAVVVWTTRDGTRVLFSAAEPAAAAACLREGSSGSFAIAPPAESAVGFVVGLGALLLVPVTLLLVAIFRAMVRTRFVVDEAGLRIRGMFSGKPYPHGVLRLDAARVVDLDASPELRVRIRLWGAGMPGYVAGWCWLRSGEKALVQLTARRPVLYLPTTRGHSLLLSSADAEVLLASLREHAAAGTTG